MREEQDKLVDFMAHAPVGIFSVDQHGRFRFVNETLAGWLQTTPKGLIEGDVRIHDVLNEPPCGVAAYAIAAGPKGEQCGEVVLRRRDGTFFPVAITQTLVRAEDGKGLRTRSVVRDLSPEREWQMALFASEYRFQRLFAEAPIGIVLLDDKQVVMECNQSFLNISRRKREGVINLSVGELIVPKDRRRIEDELADVLGGKELIKPLEAQIHADRTIIAHLFAKPFGSSTAEGGAPDGLMLYFIDVTDFKSLEDQFSQSQKMQAVGQLAGGVAHDFNNLLTAMNGFCDLLLQRHKPGDPSFADIMQIRQNGNRAAGLVRQLLAFSRQQTLQPKVTNTVDAVTELTTLMRRLLGSSIKLDLIHGRNVGFVRVDKVQLEQVVVNLAVNARDAMAGGINKSLLVRTGDHIQQTTVVRGEDRMAPGRYVTIEMIDNGCGIPPEILPQIFNPFFSTKKVGEGTGLGLSTVYGIVRQTGGFIDVESEVGKGTYFTIYIPALTEEEVAAAIVESDESEEERPAPDLTGYGTLMLVEDEEAVRIFSARVLRNKGYEVFEANSGEEALQILEKEGDQIDLIVTDVVMPEMDGPTLYRHIQERWPAIKVVFVSGYTEDRLREQFKDGEEFHFLGKPFSLKQLAQKVKEILQDR
jgi:two-component system cell cycle sensor histidine kinase/response regulator CckA